MTQASQANICVRLDKKLKKQFDYLCNEFGLTMTTAINMFVKAVVRENRIPFEIAINMPNEATRKAIEDAQKGIGLSGPFDSREDLMKSLLADDENDKEDKD